MAGPRRTRRWRGSRWLCWSSPLVVSALPTMTIQPEEERRAKWPNWMSIAVLLADVHHRSPASCSCSRSVRPRRPPHGAGRDRAPLRAASPPLALVDRRRALRTHRGHLATRRRSLEDRVGGLRPCRVHDARARPRRRQQRDRRRDDRRLAERLEGTDRPARMDRGRRSPGAVRATSTSSGPTPPGHDRRSVYRRVRPGALGIEISRSYVALGALILLGLVISLLVVLAIAFLRPRDVTGRAKAWGAPPATDIHDSRRRRAAAVATRRCSRASRPSGAAPPGCTSPSRRGACHRGGARHRDHPRSPGPGGRLRETRSLWAIAPRRSS